MVNGPFPQDDRTGIVPAHARQRRACERAGRHRNKQPAAFAQILDKLYFFKLRENLRRILLDYAQKRPRLANAAFSRGC
jgi:hypothetical protein